MRLLATALSLALGLAACISPESSSGEAPSGNAPPIETVGADSADCAPDNGGITLMDGLCAQVFAEGVGRVRHIAVSDDGTLYAHLRETAEGGGIVALRDTTGDHVADAEARFGDFGGTGIAIHDGHLYASSDVAVYRWPLPTGDALTPSGEPETIVSGFPEQNQHAAKSFAITPAGELFVNVGAPSNACQAQSRTPGSPGRDPCPLLETTGGVWRFSATETGQTFSPQARFASGIRNAVAIDWDPRSEALYVVQHGRDQLHSLWPERYTEEHNAELPAEQMLRLTEGTAYAWPYCYYDPEQRQLVLAPEYGGDGTEVGRCADFPDPVAAFPAHWAPNGLLFPAEATTLPERVRDGALVAFHGSWNRAPLPQRGFKVMFVPTSAEGTAGQPEVFADGFTGAEGPVESPRDAEFRPMGLAVSPDGALYISDSQRGRIWRIASSN